MKNLIIQTVFCSSIALSSMQAVWIEPVQAQAVCADLKVKATGASDQWGSGWMDIETTTFKQGDKLTLRIGGTAQKIIIRLLPDGKDAAQQVGIIEGNDGPIFEVPGSKVIEITLQKDHPNVKQISVHGGPRPWIYDLGVDNGPATLMSASCQ